MISSSSPDEKTAYSPQGRYRETASGGVGSPRERTSDMGSGINRMNRVGSRAQRRAGTKSTVIPGAAQPSQGKNGARTKYRLGRFGRPKGILPNVRRVDKRA